MNDEEFDADRCVQFTSSLLRKSPADEAQREKLNERYGSYCIITARGALRAEKVLIGRQAAKKARGAANGTIVLLLAGYYENPGDARERFEAMFSDKELVGRLMAYHEIRRIGSHLF